MELAKWIEDTIYTVYRRYDLKGCKKQQERLKRLCVDEVNSHKGIKDTIKDNNQMEYFVIQMALENMIVSDNKEIPKSESLLAFEKRQKEEWDKCVKLLRGIWNSEDTRILGEKLVCTFFKEAESDDEAYDKKGLHAIQNICNGNIDFLLMTLCGWSLKTLMIKAKIMKDTELEYHDEIIDAIYASTEDDYPYIERYKCKINMKTFEVFDIECVGKSSVKYYDNGRDEWIEIGDDIYPLYPKDESEGLPYHVFWYGENE